MSKQVKYQNGYIGIVSDPVAAILAVSGEATICRPRPFGGDVTNNPATIERIRRDMQADAQAITAETEAAHV